MTIDKNELAEVLKQNLKIEVSLSRPAWCSPRVETKVYFDGELIAESDSFIDSDIFR